jgi:DNA-binding NarL/FixJ family response regulator
MPRPGEPAPRRSPERPEPDVRITGFRHGEDELLVVSYPIRRPPAFARLNRAELEVIEAVLEGTPQRLIAKRRNVAVRTVTNQLARAYKKLGVGSAREVVLLVSAAARGPAR